MPSPPNFLGLQSFSHPTRAHFLLLWCPFHKKLRWRLLMALMTETGAAKAVKRYVGRACRTDLSRTNLAAIFKGLKVQLLKRLAMDRSRLSHEMDFADSSERGIPR